MFHNSRLTLKHSLALELRRLRYGRPRKKVFCVGFQKTGTTSLQYALSLLGYLVPPRLRPDPVQTALAIGAVLLSLGGTQVLVDCADAKVRIRIF